MPDTCNAEEYGKPVAAAKDADVVEVYDAKHGKYLPHDHPSPTTNPATKHDPKPFGGAK